MRGRSFSSGEAMERAELVDETLRAALADAEIRDAGELGRRLGALARQGRDVGGWTVQRLARDAEGVIWSVYVTTERHSRHT
jgi:hypothetical protein